MFVLENSIKLVDNGNGTYQLSFKDYQNFRHTTVEYIFDAVQMKRGNKTIAQVIEGRIQKITSVPTHPNYASVVIDDWSSITYIERAFNTSPRVLDVGDYYAVYNGNATAHGFTRFSSTNDPVRGGYGLVVKEQAKAAYQDIPSEINGKPVLSLRYCFWHCKNMQKLPSIPDSVVYIDNMCQNCDVLEEVVVPKNAIFGNSAFFGCKSLTQIDLPECLTKSNNFHGIFFDTPAVKELTVTHQNTVDLLTLFGRLGNLEKISVPHAEQIAPNYKNFIKCAPRLRQIVVTGKVKKGDLITMKLDGVNRRYRVLKTEDNVVEVVAMFNINSRNFGNSNVYNGSALDTFLNTTWYNALTNIAKGAIVDKKITQYKYSCKGSVYNAAHASYADYSTKVAVGSAITRHVYALDVEDIENYFDGVFSTADIWTLFGNTNRKPSTATYLWLRSAGADNFSGAFCAFGNLGDVGTIFVNSSFAARPAFQIDLSKIEYKVVR